MKVFCYAKEAKNGKTYYQGFQRGKGKVTVMTGHNEKSGKDVLIVNMRSGGGYGFRNRFSALGRSRYRNYHSGGYRSGSPTSYPRRRYRY